jgi:L-aspartate semialdehyde sulfurtransferase ferredoxin
MMAFLRVRLTFPPELITEPVIYKVGRLHNVVTNIRRANVTAETGWVVLEITGEPDELERAVDYLRNIRVQVEPVEGDLVQ